jgi:hypothetical protein
MASESPSYLRLLWVPIVMALIAAGIVTLRGCNSDYARTTEARKSTEYAVPSTERKP